MFDFGSAFAADYESSICRLCLGDTLKLAFAPEIGLGEHAEDIEEALVGGRAGIDRPFGGCQARAFSLDHVDDYPAGRRLSDFSRMKAQALVVTLDYGDGNGGVEIVLKDGALDRLFGDGVNPDPYGFDADPKRSTS